MSESSEKLAPSSLDPKPVALARRNSFAVRAKQPVFKFSAALEKAGEISAESYSLEDFRQQLKKIFIHSTFGGYYENAMLFISVISCIEYIYQTYLHPSIPADKNQLDNLKTIELIFACFFGFDWSLSLYLAEHRVIYMTRYINYDFPESYVTESNLFIHALVFQFLLCGGSTHGDSHVRDV